MDDLKKEHSMSLPPPTGAYYRVHKSVDGLVAGELILLWTEEGRICGQRGAEDYHYDAPEFWVHFVPAPEGRAERLSRIENLLAEANSSDNVSPDLPLLPGEMETSESTALITGQQKISIIEAKKAALMAKQRVEVIKEEMQGLLKEQQQALKLAARKWAKHLGMLDYAITSINLYLGRDEQIVCIQEGAPASAQEPISIRQTVLFMDEETALYAEDGGIDFKNLSDFDAWLCNPENLNQILPEEKGIIAMRLRRGEKFYANEDIWTRIAFNLANGGSYVLVRNGARLWRIWNEFDLPGCLFPTNAEFETLFYDDWSKEQLRPGTPKYQKALDRADGLRRRYLQTALLLQGLMDRTQIFKPLPVDRVNLLDPAPDPTVIRLIRDAEHILGSGQQSYDDWLYQLNAKLDVGKRIVFGGTDYIAYKYESRKDGYSRVKPKFGAWPEHLKIYTLKGTSEDEEFYFHFPRERVKANGSFHCNRQDPFILNFDDATEADIKFYLGDRCNRHHYLTSFPTLRAALALKVAERTTEEPFVELLVKDAVQKHQTTAKAARDLVGVIIGWWKQKNQVSRNLTQDERVAYAQILREVGLRIGIQDNRADASTVERIQGERADWLVIAKDAKHSVVCLRSVPNVKGLVTREAWDVTGQQCTNTRECYMPDSEHGRWQVLAERPEWKGWPKHGRHSEYLSELEYQELLRQTMATVEGLRRDKDLLHLAAITANNRGIYLHGEFDASSWSGPKRSQWACKWIPWARSKAGGAYIDENQRRWKTYSSDLVLDSTQPSPNEPPEAEKQWDHVKERLNELTPEMKRLPFTAYGYRILLYDEKELQECQNLARVRAHKRSRQCQRQTELHQLIDAVRNEIERRFWEHERDKYMADGGVEGLWEDHAKFVKYKTFDLRETDLESCLEFLIKQAGFSKVVGKQLSEAWTLAESLGWKAGDPEANRTLPGNIVLK
jgi:hypothetical protein